MSAHEPSPTDNLLRQLLSESEHHRDQVFADLRERFVRIAKRRIGVQDAEDVANEACLTVFEKYRDLPADVNFAAWMYQVLRNKIGNRLQQRARSKPSAGAAVELLSAPLASTALEIRLLACLHRIFQTNSRYARVLNLAHLGFSAAEICQKIGTSKENLYVLLNRSRAQLRRCLKESEPHE